jgi:hypothetical protein
MQWRACVNLKMNREWSDKAKGLAKKNLLSMP